jgi:hypothetical protein
MKPHDGYVRQMLDFAKGLAEDLRVPLTMTLFASPDQTGLGLLKIGLGYGESTIAVSELSILGPESKEILFRNKDKLVASPTPVIFQYEGNSYFVGAEKDWVRANISKLSATLARNFIQKLGIRQGR